MPFPGSFRSWTKSRPKSLRTRRDRVILFCFVAFTIAFISIYHQPLASSISLQPPTMDTASPVFSLLVTAQFDTVERKEQFLEEIKPVAEYVQSSEPDTLAYEVLISDKDPCQVLILERYKDKDNAYLKIHKSSAPFLVFRKKLQVMQDEGQITISGNSYLDSGVGFGDRSKA